jgi:hypothetical protein
MFFFIFLIALDTSCTVGGLISHSGPKYVSSSGVIPLNCGLRSSLKYYAYTSSLHLGQIILKLILGKQDVWMESDLAENRG